MQDSGAEQGAGVQHSRPQLTPRTLLPRVSGARPSLSKHHAAAGSKGGGFSSRLVGSSSHVPSLATYMGMKHAVADQGELSDLSSVGGWQVLSGKVEMAEVVCDSNLLNNVGYSIGAKSDRTQLEGPVGDRSGPHTTQASCLLFILNDVGVGVLCTVLQV